MECSELTSLKTLLGHSSESGDSAKRSLKRGPRVLDCRRSTSPGQHQPCNQPCSLCVFNRQGEILGLRVRAWPPVFESPLLLPVLPSPLSVRSQQQQRARARSCPAECSPVLEAAKLPSASPGPQTTQEPTTRSGAMLRKQYRSSGPETFVLVTTARNKNLSSAFALRCTEVCFG